MNTNVFLYFTESATQDSSDKIQSPISPLGNRFYRYELVDNKLINPGNYKYDMTHWPIIRFLTDSSRS